MNIAFLHLHWGGGTYKSKRYKSYTLARSVRENGKNNHKSEVKLGKLTKDEVRWWKKLLLILKNPSSVITTLEDIVTKKHYAYCDIAVVNKFWKYWKLDNAFKITRKGEIPLSSIAKILTINRCVMPKSKSSVTKWFSTTSLPQLLDINTDKINNSRLFRELKYIENNKENITNHLFEQYKKHYPNDLNQVYYDLSSTTFSGTKCIISKYGHCKEGYQTHVVLALLVTENGLPFYWEVLPGGTADAKTVNWLLEHCKNKFQKLNITAVFDRGFVSDKNLTNFEEKKIKYISAMDRNQIKGICEKMIDFTKFPELTIEGVYDEIDKNKDFNKIDKNTYYKEIKVENKRRYILCFNPQLFVDQRKAREQSIDVFKSEIIPEINEELLDAKKSRVLESTKNKFQKEMRRVKITSFANIELEPIYIKGDKSEIKTFQGSLNIDNSKKKKAIELDGFWLLVSNLSDKNNMGEFIVSSENALSPYREKVIIEDAFRDIKSFLDIAPVYVWLEKHIKAHYTICVLSYLINRTISNLLKENKGNLSKDVKTHCSVFSELKENSIDEIYIKNLDQSNYCLTMLTNKQNEILKRLEISGIEKVNVILNKFRREQDEKLN
jgi:transposase